MSSRSFSTTTKKFVQLIGRVTLRDVADINGSNGPEWANKVQNVAETIENERNDVVSYEIQGAMAHKSRKDPNETQDVITLGLYSAKGTRIGSAHAREDGTYTFRASRAGR